jgi:hypothetical protein
LKSPRIKVLIIAKKVNIQRVTGPDVPVNFSPANSKDKFDPVTMSSVSTIVKAMTDAKTTAPNIAKLGWMGQFHHILTPIIKDIPRKIHAKTAKRKIFRRLLSSGLRWISWSLSCAAGTLAGTSMDRGSTSVFMEMQARDKVILEIKLRSTKQFAPLLRASVIRGPRRRPSQGCVTDQQQFLTLSGPMRKRI